MTAPWLKATGAMQIASVPTAYQVGELLLQWPILTPVGLRRFDARQDLPLSERNKWAVRAVDGLPALSLPPAPRLWPADGVADALLPDVTMLLLHRHSTVLIFCGPSGRDAIPLSLLGLTMTMVALAPLPEG